MKKINSSIFFFLIFSMFSCENNFEETNTNPNVPTDVEPGLLLRQILYNYGDEMSYEGFVAGNLLAQHFTMVDFNLFDRHDLSSPQLGGNPWPVIYKNLLDNERILEKSRSEISSSVYEGPALILKAYMTAALTDIYGDIPYSEALKGAEGITTPGYDSQEDIYTGENGILDNLKNGVASINQYSGNRQLEGDVLFNGDLNAWITFARSLRLKYLMRISDRINISNELQNLYDEGDYMDSNSQNGSFNFTDGQPNSFRMQQLRDGDFNLYILSETLHEIFGQLNDPRLGRLFRPVGNNPAGTQYQGLLNGPDASQTSISINDFSLTGTIFRENTGLLDANFMTAWETHFLWAEAAERGLVNADPKHHYDTGVQLAFEYWQTEIPEDYLTNGNATYGINNTNKIEQIITQKWIANSINGYEGWIEYRRTGFPILKTISASLNNDLIPLKMPYPADEATLNTDNFNNAAGADGNSINVKVWWDMD